MEPFYAVSEVVWWFGLAMAIVVVANVVLLVVHELGHLVVGLAIGSNISTFSIGSGPLIFERNVRGTQLAIRANPLTAGFVVATPRTDGNYRLRQLVFLAAGMAASLLFFVLIFGVILDKNGTIFQTAVVPAGIALVGQLWGSLRPNVHVVDGVTLVSDGAQMLALMRNDMTSVDFAEVEHQRKVDAVLKDKRLEDLLPLALENLERHPNDCRALGLYGIGLIGRHREAEAIDPLRKSLAVAAEEEETHELFLAQTETNLAHCLLVNHDRSLVAEATVLAESAVRRIRRDELNATLGAALVMGYDVARGLQLLEKSRVTNDLDRAFRLAFMAIGAFRSADFARAKELADEARELGNPSMQHRLAELDAALLNVSV